MTEASRLNLSFPVSSQILIEILGETVTIDDALSNSIVAQI